MQMAGFPFSLSPSNSTPADWTFRISTKFVFFPKTPGAYLTQWSSGQFWRNVQKHPKENHLGTYFWKVNSWFLTPRASECFVARPETTHVKLILHLILLGSQIPPLRSIVGSSLKPSLDTKPSEERNRNIRRPSSLINIDFGFILS